MSPRKAPSLDEIEATNEDHGAPINIPPNADVQIKFKHTVDPGNLADQTNRNRYSDELRELAAEEYAPDVPTDPLSEFVAEWVNYIGYPLKMVRLPDPAPRRIPGHTYNRACFELEQLSDMPFDPANLVGSIQIVNGNSGGVFRLWLTDETGAPIPGARLDRIAIADPPKQFGNFERDGRERERDLRYYQPREPAPPPAKPEPSALELRMQDLQEKLLSNAVSRLLEPPPPPQQQSAPQLNDEDRLTLLLVKEGGLLPVVVGKLAALAGAPEAATAKETWQERLLNAGVHIAETNPAIVERVSGTLERIVNRILPAPQNERAQPWQPQPQFYPEQARELQPSRAPHPQPPPVNNSDLPGSPDDTEEEGEEDPELMAILEDLFTLLTTNEPLTATHPIFLELQKDYPLKFRMAITLIASQPLPDIIDWIKEKSPLYEAMLESPGMGPHYERRLAELQALARSPAPQPEQHAPIANDEKENNTAPPDKAPRKATREKAGSPSA